MALPATDIEDIYMRLAPPDLAELLAFVAARLEDDHAEAHAHTPPDEMLLDLCQMTSELLSRVQHTDAETSLSKRTEMTLRMVARCHSTHPDYQPF